MIPGSPKVAFLDLPTPIDHMPAVSRELGIELYLKRDDMSGPGGGGNKLRKLEYLLGRAREQKATMLLTVGGPQTNHGRLTAAVAAKYGLKCVIACVGDHPEELSANLLLDRIMGAEVVLKKSDGSGLNEQLDSLARELAARYEAQGETVYSIPLGGSNDTGLLGYYECAVETTGQAREMGLEDARVIMGVGSLGTLVGFYCGLKNEHSPLCCTGVAVMPFDAAMEERLEAYCATVNERYGFAVPVKVADLDIETGYVRGGYNLPSREVREAIYLMARKEGVILDPCYTGKCLAGIMDMIREGKIATGEKIIMIHTGGLPGIYTKHHRLEFEKELMGGISFLD